MKITLTDKLRARILTLLDRYERQVETVREDIEAYMTGENITKLKISRDVSAMKTTFKQIDLIMKEIK